MSSLKERVTSAAVGFSLIAFAQACESNGGKVDTPTHPANISDTPTMEAATPAPESEYQVKVVISYYLSSEIPNLPLDENCGHWLSVGDKSTFSSPLPPGEWTLKFTAELTNQQGIPFFGGIPAVANTHLKAEFELPGGTAILPLGMINSVEANRIYFTPYLPASGKPNEDCIQQQEPTS